MHLFKLKQLQTAEPHKSRKPSDTIRHARRQARGKGVVVHPAGCSLADPFCHDTHGVPRENTVTGWGYFPLVELVRPGSVPTVPSRAPSSDEAFNPLFCEQYPRFPVFPPNIGKRSAESRTVAAGDKPQMLTRTQRLPAFLLFPAAAPDI